MSCCWVPSLAFRLFRTPGMSKAHLLYEQSVDFHSGAGMVELCSHISTIDFVAVSGKKSILEYTDHLHEVFEAPARILDGYHVTPTVPGYSCDVKESEFEKYESPHGSFWSSVQGQKMLSDPWRGVPGEQTS